MVAHSARQAVECQYATPIPEIGFLKDEFEAVLGADVAHAVALRRDIKTGWP
jgi:hypothetical protein